MPLPLIPVAVGVVSGIAALFGAKKGVDAYSDNKEAGDLRAKAANRFDKAKTQLVRAKEKCNSELESLGQLRLELFQQQIGRFVSLFSEFRDVQVSDLDQLGTADFSADFSKEKLEAMRAQSSAASEVLKVGVSSLGTGALAGVASYGAATMLGSASTGTAISTLSGVAATNATLAWFGGGSLAAGGLGMAGGAAVLGGIVAGPVLAVGGMVLAAKARENLANARRTDGEAKKAASEMKAARAVVEAITVVAGQFQEVSKQLNDRFTLVLDDLEMVIERKRRRWRWLLRWLPWKLRISLRRLPESDQHKVHHAWLFAQTFKDVLDAPLLTEEGAPSETAGQVLADGTDLIRRDEESGATGLSPPSTDTTTTPAAACPKDHQGGVVALPPLLAGTHAASKKQREDEDHGP